MGASGVLESATHDEQDVATSLGIPDRTIAPDNLLQRGPRAQRRHKFGRVSHQPKDRRLSLSRAEEVVFRSCDLLPRGRRRVWVRLRVADVCGLGEDVRGLLREAIEKDRPSSPRGLDTDIKKLHQESGLPPVRVRAGAAQAQQALTRPSPAGTYRNSTGGPRDRGPHTRASRRACPPGRARSRHRPGPRGRSGRRRFRR